MIGPIIDLPPLLTGVIGAVVGFLGAVGALFKWFRKK